MAGQGTVHSPKESLRSDHCPLPYHFGNSGGNILRGPGLVNFDFSLFKKFSIKEKAAIEERGEFFSLFNTPRFNLPNRSVDVPQGGVFSSAQAARQVQLALRLTF